jgi:hypothetical protein
MKAALEKELSALTLEEKNEVFTYLVPFVTPVDDFSISPGLMTELNRRIEEDDKFPETAISFEQFKSHWSHRK